MQLSTDTVINNKYLTDRDGNAIDRVKHKDHIFISSIDLTIRDILIKKEKEKDGIGRVDNYLIQPQETVYLVSEQFLNVPVGFVAYVFLKNKLSQSGILALNTGIVDSGYTGPISTIVTNFSKESVSLRSQDSDALKSADSQESFFRVVFHQINCSDDEKNAVVPRVFEYNAYLAERVTDLKKLPQYFLDPVSLKKKIDEELSEKAINIGYRKVGFLFTVVTLLFIFIPMITKEVRDNWYGNDEKTTKDVIELRKKFNALKSDIDKLIGIESIKVSNIPNENLLTEELFQTGLDKLINKHSELLLIVQKVKKKQNDGITLETSKLLSIEEDIQLLEREINKLKIEYGIGEKITEANVNEINGKLDALNVAILNIDNNQK